MGATRNSRRNSAGKPATITRATENGSSVARRPAAPVKVSLTIEEIAFGGDGVGRAEGIVWFVPGVIAGEQIEAEMVERRAGFIRGKVVRVLRPSPERIQAPCQYFGVCGGCAYQHISYQAQLLMKTDQVRQTLKRIGHLPDAPISPAVASPAPYGFRNRLTVHCDGNKVGFYARRASHLVDIERCLLAEPAVNEALTRFRQKHPSRGHRTLRASGDRAPFDQTNPAVAALLQQRVLAEAALLPKRETAVDAYCGSGFFTGPLAGLGFQRVLGIDWSEPAIEAARRQETPGAEYQCGSVDELLEKALADDPDLLLLDPPREGFSKTVASIIGRSQVANVFYISCNPSTFARDARLLVNCGFLLAVAIPFDMFPQTSEIEVLGVFRRSADGEICRQIEHEN